MKPSARKSQYRPNSSIRNHSVTVGSHSATGRNFELPETDTAAKAEYELIDFGGGRKLERFGLYLLDRPALGTEGLRAKFPAPWREATARFELHDETKSKAASSQRGKWLPPDALPERWTIAVDAVRLELATTSFGHIGLFAEQIENWRWLADRIRQRRPVAPSNDKKIKVLNLFAHTGGSTLAAAAAGAEVVHVDSARSVVAWARRNAELSGLADAPIHWIVDDAASYVRRELARGKTYDAVVLDPPSYGHGTKGEVWKVEPRSAGFACRVCSVDRRPVAIRFVDLPFTCCPSRETRTLDESGIRNQAVDLQIANHLNPRSQTPRRPRRQNRPLPASRLTKSPVSRDAQQRGRSAQPTNIAWTRSPASKIPVSRKPSNSATAANDAD